MKKNEFKSFISAVERADQNSEIWWAGCLWLNLTKSQVLYVNEILDRKGCINSIFDSKGKKFHLLPSGITVAEA